MKIRIVKKIMNRTIKHYNKIYSKYCSNYYIRVRQDFLKECLSQYKHILNNSNKEIKPFMRFIKEYKHSVLNKPIYEGKNPLYIRYFIQDVFDICMNDDI